MAFLFADLSCHCVLNIGYRGGGIGRSETPSHAADAPYSQFKDDDIAHGWDGTCPWSVDKDGTLTLWEGTPVPYTRGVKSFDQINASEEDIYDFIPDADGKPQYWGYGNIEHGWIPYRKYVKKARILEQVSIESGEYLLAGLSNMTSVELPEYMNDITSMAGFFDGDLSLTFVDLSGKSIPNCTNLDYMFRNCLELEWVYLSDLDTSKVERARYMFQQCQSIINIDLSNFDTTSLNNAGGIFYGCSSMETLDIRNFKLPSGVLDINAAGTAHIDSGAFARCSSLKRISLGDNTLSKEFQYAGFATQPPTTYPYTGKWVKEDAPSVVLTTSEFLMNYPSSRAPVGTYIWQISDDTAQISFDANGGEASCAPIIMKDTISPVILSAEGTLRGGHKLMNWNTERDGSGISYAVNSTYTPVLGTNTTLYAQWAPHEELAPLDYVIEGYGNLDRNGIYEDPVSDDMQGYHRIGSEVELTLWAGILPDRRKHFVPHIREQLSCYLLSRKKKSF